MAEEAGTNFLDFLDELDEIAPLKEEPRVERPASPQQHQVPQDSEEDGPSYQFIANPAMMFKPYSRTAEDSAATADAQEALPSYTDLLDKLEEDSGDEEEDEEEVVEDEVDSRRDVVTSEHQRAVASATKAEEVRERLASSENELRTSVASSAMPAYSKPKGGRRVIVGAPPQANSDDFDLKVQLKTIPAHPEPSQKKDEVDPEDQSLEAILARLDRDEEEESAQKVWDDFRELSQVEGREIQSRDSANLPGMLGPSMKALTGPLVKMQEEQRQAAKEELMDFKAPDEEYLSLLEEQSIRMMEREKKRKADRDAKLMARVQKAIDRERSGGVRSVVPPAQRKDRLGLAALKPMGHSTPARSMTGAAALDEIFGRANQVPRINATGLPGKHV